MSKAEERALEAYPIKNEWIGNQYGVYGDINEDSREKFIQGYEQAEKDLLEQAKIMDEVDKRKEVIQNEKELNPDAFTKEVSADNQALENAANAYIGHAPDIDESSSVYGERQAQNGRRKMAERILG